MPYEIFQRQTATEVGKKSYWVKIYPKDENTCPHCHKTINSITNYTRWHGDRCKMRNQNIIILKHK